MGVFLDTGCTFSSNYGSILLDTQHTEFFPTLIVEF